MTVSGNAKAYPLSAISQETVIDGHFTGEEVAIPFYPTSESSAAFVWWLKDKFLSFEPTGRAFIWDRETRSLWQALTGQAVEGELSGERLERLSSHYSCWFAWSDFHPQTELYGAATG